MDGEKFDDLLKKVCTTRLTRLGVVRGLAVAAVATITGSAFGSDDADARKRGGGGKKRGGGGKKGKRSRSSHQVTKPCTSGNEVKHLGQSCGATQCCVASEGLVCEKVAATGAHRCECDLHRGFISCGGTCVQSNCPAGTTPSCNSETGQLTCSCPGNGELCTPEGSTQAVCVDCQTEETGLVPDPDTCQCVCPEVNGDPGQFCGGECHYEAECAGLHNKILNVRCCNEGANPCQNPGQPSQRCKR